MNNGFCWKIVTIGVVSMSFGKKNGGKIKKANSGP